MDFAILIRARQFHESLQGKLFFLRCHFISRTLQQQPVIHLLLSNQLGVGKAAQRLKNNSRSCEDGGARRPPAARPRPGPARRAATLLSPNRPARPLRRLLPANGRPARESPRLSPGSDDPGARPAASPLPRPRGSEAAAGRPRGGPPEPLRLQPGRGNTASLLNFPEVCPSAPPAPCRAPPRLRAAGGGRGALPPGDRQPRRQQPRGGVPPPPNAIPRWTSPAPPLSGLPEALRAAGSHPACPALPGRPAAPGAAACPAARRSAPPAPASSCTSSSSGGDRAASGHDPPQLGSGRAALAATPGVGEPKRRASPPAVGVVLYIFPLLLPASHRGGAGLGGAASSVPLDGAIPGAGGGGSGCAGVRPAGRWVPGQARPAARLGAVIAAATVSCRRGGGPRPSPAGRNPPPFVYRCCTPSSPSFFFLQLKTDFSNSIYKWD